MPKNLLTLLKLFMREKRKLNLKFVMFVLGLALFLNYSCSNLEETTSENLKMSTSKISKEDLLDNLKDINLRDFVINNNFFNNEDKLSKNSNANPIFEMITKPNEYVNYSLQLGSYTVQNPYLKFFVINKNNIGETAGFVYYYPSTPLNKIDGKNFTGKIEMYDIEGRLAGKTTFVNSIAQPNSNSTTNRGVECVTTYSLNVVNCSHGGGHPPGTNCNDGSPSDGYYEIRSTVKCSWKALVAAPDVVAGFSGGGGANIAYNEPCATLTQATNTPNYKTKFNNLNKQEKFNSPVETGFALAKNSTGVYYNKDLLAIGGTSLKPDKDAINFTHVHNNHMALDSVSGQMYDSGVKILSPGDIFNITSSDSMLNNASAAGFEPSSCFATMISNEGIFSVAALVPNIVILKKDYENFKRIYYEKAEEIILTKRSKYNNPEKRKKALEKMLLKLIDETPGYKGNLGLFEGDASDPNNLKWIKKELNSSGDVVPTPC